MNMKSKMNRKILTCGGVCTMIFIMSLAINILVLIFDADRELYILDTKSNRGDLKYDNVNLTTNSIHTKHKRNIDHKNAFLINEPNKCGDFGIASSSDQPTILIAVLSSMKNKHKRHAIRKTWAEKAIKNKSIKLIFILGVNIESTEKEQFVIQKESETYRDIIQVDLVDTYKNLTLKSLAMLEWTQIYCDSVRFLVKADDDSFINIPNLIKLLFIHSKETNEKVILGYIFKDVEPVRNTTSVYYTPKSIYNNTIFPPYASGGVYIISRTLIPDILRASTKLQYFFMEDIYITGLCAELTNASHIHISTIEYRKIILDPCIYKHLISAHGLGISELFEIWRLMLSYGTSSC